MCVSSRSVALVGLSVTGKLAVGGGQGESSRQARVAFAWLVWGISAINSDPLITCCL